MYITCIYDKHIDCMALACLVNFVYNDKYTMFDFVDSMELKPIVTRKLRRRQNDPMPIPEKRRKPSPDILCLNIQKLNSTKFLFN